MKILSGKVILFFEGNLTEELISYLVHFAEKSFSGTHIPILIQKRVINVLVESVQNIFHHGSKQAKNTSVVVISRIKNKYRISTANTIDKKEVCTLKEKLEQALTMNKDELRSHYIKKLGEKASEDPKPGTGAGIGILDMARRSNQKVSYSFEETKDKNKQLFILNVDVKIK